MKHRERLFGIDYHTLMPTRKELRAMRQEFELNALFAALSRGMISPDRFEKLFHRRIQHPKQK